MSNTVISLLNQTTSGSLHSPCASEYLVWSWPCHQFTTVPSMDHYRLGMPHMRCSFVLACFTDFNISFEDEMCTYRITCPTYEQVLWWDITGALPVSRQKLINVLYLFIKIWRSYFKYRTYQQLTINPCRHRESMQTLHTKYLVFV